MPVQEIIAKALAEVRSAWRFRWYGAALAWTLCLVGFGIVALQPNIYQADARVYVDASSVLRPLLNNRIVPPDIGTVLAYVRQQLLGRKNLEQMASENGLDAGATSPAELDLVLAKLRDSIQISSRDLTNSVYTISYRDSQRQRAVGVVQTLLSSLVGDTLGANLAGTETAEQFVNDRIKEYETRLQAAEEKRADFMKRNAGRLPGSQGGYFQRMQNEQQELEEAQRKLRLAESKRDKLRAQLNNESSSDAESDLPSTSLDKRISDYRTQLDHLLLQYTDQHPDVVAIREALARLEAQRAAQLKELGQSAAGQNFSALDSNPIYQALRIALNDAEVEIATLQADVAQRKKKLEETKSLVDELPEVEAELARLNRDYDVINDQYQALVKSRETQSLSQKAFDTDKVNFRVIDPPAASEKPVAPKRVRLLALVFVAALGAAGGLCWLVAQLRPVFGTTESLRALCGLPVVGAIGVFGAAEHPIRRRLALVGFVGVMGGLAALFAAALIMEAAGPGLHTLAGLV